MIEIDGNKVIIIKAKSNDRFERKRPDESTKNASAMDMCISLKPKWEYYIMEPSCGDMIGQKKIIECFFTNQKIASYERLLAKNDGLSKKLLIKELGFTVDFEKY